MKNLFFKSQRLDSAYAYMKSHPGVKTAEELAEAMLQSKEKEWSRFNSWVRPLLSKSVQSAAQAVFKVFKTTDDPLKAALERSYQAQPQKDFARYGRILSRRFASAQPAPKAAIQDFNIYQNIKNCGHSDNFTEKLFLAAQRFCCKGNKSKLPLEDQRKLTARFLETNWGFIKQRLEVYDSVFKDQNLRELLEFLDAPHPEAKAQREICAKMTLAIDSLPQGHEKEFFYPLLSSEKRELIARKKELLDHAKSYAKDQFSRLIQNPGQPSPQLLKEIDEGIEKNQTDVTETRGRRHSSLFEQADLRFTQTTVKLPQGPVDLPQGTLFADPKRGSQDLRNRVEGTLETFSEGQSDSLVFAQTLASPIYECDAEAFFNRKWKALQIDSAVLHVTSRLTKKTIEKSKDGIIADFDFDYSTLEIQTGTRSDTHKVQVRMEFSPDKARKWHLVNHQWNYLGIGLPVPEPKAAQTAVKEVFEDDGVVTRPD